MNGILKRLISLALICILFLASFSQIQVSNNKRYLVKKDGKAFFWLGDTAWELFHRLDREQAKNYLKNRADKGFTVIQAVALAELDGLNTPNVYGDKALLDNDPTKPNEAYFKHVDFIVNEAAKLGLIMALLPTWGDKWHDSAATVFNVTNAKSYGAWIAKRYINQPVVWVLGGDRKPENANHLAIIRAMAEGIKQVDNGKHLITFHPRGASSSYEYFADDDWIDFHMSQTGHYVGSPDYNANIKAMALKNLKPHVNGEPNYEDHPNNWKPGEKGWMDDFDTREAAYWNMLSGGAGHTYGNHNIWQMWTEGRKAINNARTTWEFAMNHPGAYQVGFMRRMFEKRNWQNLIPDQSLIEGDNPEGVEYKVAAISAEGDFMMVYIPYGRKTTISLAKLKATKLRGWWFNPRDGKTIAIGDFENTNSKEFTPLSIGRGSDWVLIVDDVVKNYPDPKAG